MATQFQRTGVVTLRGPLFEKRIDRVVEAAIMRQAMEKFEKRVRRTKKSGHILGRKRNPIGPGDLTKGKTIQLQMRSTLRNPRTTGKAWTRANVAAIKSMTPFVLRDLAKKIVAELS